MQAISDRKLKAVRIPGGVDMAEVERGPRGRRERVTDFETAWDKAQPKLRPLSHDQWDVVDDAADAAIGALRSKKPDANHARKALHGLIDALDNPSAK